MSSGELSPTVGVGRENVNQGSQWPDCFFDDGSETVMRRMKLVWKPSASFMRKGREQAKSQQGRGKLHGHVSLGLKLKSVLLCGDCN